MGGRLDLTTVNWPSARQRAGGWAGGTLRESEGESRASQTANGDMEHREEEGREVRAAAALGGQGIVGRDRSCVRGEEQ